ncbi:EpsG family protein [Lactiplantibacillus plantarum]|uniref:EpsG family protein n=1 Tax=Lactiplantibacillus plantarum TaxID=1590 RepID=UPI0021CB6207|nr:EpsG family protein [Lactiplantibacillus plantarum]
MVFYFGVLGLYIILGIIINFSFENKAARIFQSLSMIVILGGLSAARAVSVGTDTQLYNNLYSWDFEAENWQNILSSKYPLYSLYTYCLHFISSNPQIIIVMNSLIIVTSVAIAIYSYSENVFLSNILYVTLYFFFNSMNISRQFLAIGILLVATVYLNKNKIWLFWILYIVACLVHSTALVGIIFFVIHVIHWNKTRFILSGSLGIVLLIFYKIILNLFIVLFPAYSMYSIGTSDTNVDTLSSQSNGGTLLVTIFYLLFICIATLCKVRFQDENREKRFAFLTVVMIIAVVFGIVFYKNILMTRVILYLSIFSIVYISEVIDLFILNIDTTSVNRWCIRFLVVCGVIAITCVSLYVQLNKNLSDVIPYVSFVAR